MQPTTVKTPQVIRRIAELRAWRSGLKGKLALVPTMGGLHAGHEALIERAKQLAEHVALWIFVNPLQFGPNEDFDKYPRTFERDLDICTAHGVNVVFAPTVPEIYPEGKDRNITVVPPADIANICEGSYRTGYFTGIATVVSKFFNIVQPEFAVFGEKDYQQLIIIQKMVADLNIPIQIEPVPIVREPDGLAVSSRNVYLTPEQRAIAPRIQKGLKAIATRFKENGGNVENALQLGREILTETGEIKLLFLEARDAATFAPHAQSTHGLVVVVSGQIGATRLLDAIRLH